MLMPEPPELLPPKTEVPVAVGFGIGSARQARVVGGLADGVIIGSRLVRIAAESADADAAAAAIVEFLTETRDALAGLERDAQSSL